MSSVAGFFNSVIANDMVIWVHIGEPLATSFKPPLDALAMKEYFEGRFRVTRVTLTHDDGDLDALQKICQKIESWKPSLHRRHDFLLEPCGYSRKELTNCFSFLLEPEFSVPKNQVDLPNKILDDVYLGDVSSSKNPVLRAMGLTRIVDASGFGELHYKDDPAFSYLVVNVDDSATAAPKLERNLSRVIQFIRQARADGEKVLIHCAAGISRSATLTLVFLMREEGMSLRDAWFLVKGSRDIVRPNSGFTQLLCDLELKLRPDAPSVVVQEGMRNSYKLNLKDLTRE